MDKNDDAATWFQRTTAILEPVLHEDPKNAEARECLRYAYSERAGKFGDQARWAEALEDWDRAISFDDSDDPQYRIMHALTLVYSGDRAKGLSEAGKMAKAEGLSPENGYKLALVFGSAALGDLASTELSDTESKKLAREDSTEAFRLLQKSASYFQTPDRLKDLDSQPALQPVRELEDFQKWRRELGSAAPMPKQGS
jgi:hypothetical protein